MKTRTRKRDRQGRQESPTDNQTTDEYAAGFTPQRGTGQGDVMSPACWAAVFDILLTALELDEENNGTTWVGADANAGYKEWDTAYADDLLSTTRDAGRLQRKADVVSAFCSIMGLQISTTKLRRFILGTQGLKDDDTRGDTIVHTFQWEAEEIHMHADEPLLYLGGQRDENGLSKTDLADTKAMVRAHCAEVGATAASAETKLGSTKLVTYAKARYKGKIASWSLKE